jgi:ribosomal-protein-alanine N-acetyltransferase
MTKIIEIKTKRLFLRQWRQQDQCDFAKLNSDPVVMEYYPRVLSAEESHTMAQKLQALIAERGWGLWAVELINGKSFIGFVGLHEPTYDLPVTPCVEIGWRLSKQYWGMGYASEAATASLNIAFNTLGLNEVFAFTSVSNHKSRAVMERIGMVNTHKNFGHPIVPPNSPLREHVLYTVDKQRWMALHD